MSNPDEKAELNKALEGSWAIAWSPEEGFSLYTPIVAESEGNREVPPMALALTACMVRLERDPEFVKECEEWFKAQSKS